MLQPNVFHEFHPIGGVRATPLSNASADDVCSTAVIADSSTPAANSDAALRGRGSRVAVTLISLLVRTTFRLFAGGAVTQRLPSAAQAGTVWHSMFTLTRTHSAGVREQRGSGAGYESFSTEQRIGLD
ncbi:hypothetical protein GCM10017567_18740 [Amycolatopsis bullii]|uniref:Uncharacterized protein n=2 Tax=Pseudonocardiaceae TaxID=2070 RepID=A0ABQ3K5S5_9PSEU|nr:hypothetical protein GCM10017567_18740 [Amycolatopsis bullii]